MHSFGSAAARPNPPHGEDAADIAAAAKASQTTATNNAALVVNGATPPLSKTTVLQLRRRHVGPNVTCVLRLAIYD